MEITQAQYSRIAHCFPKPRGILRYSHLQVLNAILFIAENGAKWRRLPERFGHWHTVYTRMRDWAKKGVLARVFEALQQEQIIQIKVEAASLDSTSIKVHPDGTGALKKTARKQSDDPGEDSRPRFIWLPQMSAQHYASAFQRANAQTARKAASCSKTGASASPRASRPS